MCNTMLQQELCQAKGKAFACLLSPSQQISNHCAFRVAGDDNKFLQLLEEVKGSLKQKGASAAVQAHVEDVLLTQHQHYHAYMTAEADKRRALIDHVKALEVSTLLLGC